MKSHIKQRVGFLSIKEASRIINIKEKQSLKMFFIKGYICVDCGIQGIYFGIDILKNKILATRLYAIDTDGNEVLMTQDHIIPISRGGTNRATNLQPMCEPCNSKKSDTIRLTEIKKEA